MISFKVGDSVLVKGKYKGKIANVNEFREPSMKFAVDLEVYKKDVVFVGEEDLKKVEVD